MQDIERIHWIAQQLGIVDLKCVHLDKLKTDNIFYTTKTSDYNINFFLSPRFPYKGTRNYSIDDDNTVTGLSLDFCTIGLLPPSTLNGFRGLKHLSIKNTQIHDASILKDLKGLTTLDLSHNNLTDISILKDLKELTTLDLSHNNLTDVTTLKDLKELTTLDLSLNNLTDTSILKDLKGLKTLDLSRNNLTDISILKHLKKLTTLDLRNNNLTDVAILKDLKKLTTLDLRSNNLTDVSILKDLKGLTSFDLSNTQVADVSILKDLKGLTTLYLSDTQVADVSILKDLKGLTSLYLDDTEITDISILKHLKGLTTLDLSHTKITDVSILKDLKKLTTLYLGHTKVTDVTTLKSLKKLTTLDLRNNNLTDVSTTLKDLKELTTLDLRNNNLTNVSILKDLKRLTTLDLRNNNLTNVSILKDLKGLTTLDLRNNNLTNVSTLKNLIGLTTLDLSHTKVTDISTLKNLIGLMTLDLSHTQVIDVSILKDLKHLRSINIQNSHVREIPVCLLDHNLDIEVNNAYRPDCINLTGNPIEIPPLDIVKQGKQAMRNYYAQITAQGGVEKLYEAKIIIVGEAGSGKTTLLKKLQDPTLGLPNTHSTLGVEVKEGQVFEHPTDPNITLRANLWDFGGQEIQYQLHQYFITPDSLYILVADNRKQHTRWDYWLQIISLLGGACPVLVVLNHHDAYSEANNFPMEKCKTHFSTLTIDHRDIDFKQNDGRWAVLQQTICTTLATLPLVNKSVPKLWKPLREALVAARKKHNYIHIKDYFSLCPKGLDTEEDRLAALNYFHCIGIVLHFSQDENLQDIVFLNPNWITQALYSALDGDNKDLKNGRFSKQWLFDFWSTHTNQYTYDERGYLLRLMLKDNFDICYAIDQQQYIVPLLLPDTKPNYTWEIRHNLGFRIQYPFMPAGIITRLIVRMHELIQDQLAWLEGVILEHKDWQCQAQIIQQKDFKSGLMYIDIRVSGATLDHKKTLMSHIRSHIDHIHKTSFQNMPCTELIVCNCDMCLDLDEPHYFSMDELQEYIAAGKLKIECRKLKEGVSINQLFGTIYSDAEIKNMMERPMSADPQSPTPAPEINSEQKKLSNTLIALLPFTVIFVVLSVSVVLFNYLNIPIQWLAPVLVASLLLMPILWSYAMSPDTISEKTALKAFDTVLRRLGFLKLPRDK